MARKHPHLTFTPSENHKMKRIKPFETWTKEREIEVRHFVQKFGFIKAEKLAKRLADESAMGTVSQSNWIEILRYLKLFKSVGRLS
jgi:hypothetical protein